jgi:DNA ligase-1
MQTKEFPILYGLSSTGKPKMWKVRVIDNGTPAIEISHGYVDGKVVVSTKEIRSGKNIGKSNETTAFEQACADAQSLWTSKKDQKYIETIPTKDTKSDIILPMLAQKFKDRKHEITYPCFAQPKLNGVRCLAQKLSQNEVKYISRGGKEFTTLQHLTPHILNILCVGDILDGEIFVKDWSFQEIIRNVKKQRETSNQLEYWIYDIANPEMTFSQRWNLIENMFLFKFDIPLKSLTSYVVNNEEQVYQFHKIFVKQGFEGIIIRNMNGKYIFHHRSKDLQKYKTFEDKEFKIIGGYEGEGLEEGCVVFVCDLGNGKEFHVRPRGSRNLRREWLRDLKNIVGKDLTVRYQELSEDSVPIFGVGIAIRDYE